MASHSSKKVIYAALAGNSLIAATKFAASAYTGSSPMLSEAIHSVVDTGNQLLLLMGLARAKRPPAREYPFGYGMELYFWTFVVAILICAVGAGISIYEGVDKLRQPHAVTDVYINYLVLAVIALLLAVECKGLLLGEATHPEVIADIRRLVADHPAVLTTNEILTMHMAPEDVLLNLSVDFADGITSADVEAAITGLERDIKAAHPEIKRVFTEAQSWRAHSEGEREK